MTYIWDVYDIYIYIYGVYIYTIYIYIYIHNIYIYIYNIYIYTICIYIYMYTICIYIYTYCLPYLIWELGFSELLRLKLQSNWHSFGKKMTTSRGVSTENVSIVTHTDLATSKCGRCAPGHIKTCRKPWMGKPIGGELHQVKTQTPRRKNKRQPLHRFCCYPLGLRWWNDRTVVESRNEFSDVISTYPSREAEKQNVRTAHVFVPWLGQI